MKELAQHLLNETTTLLCAGDIMLDSYISGGINRISPEAPIPVLNHDHYRSVPGGVGNVARNLAGLNSNVICIGLGNDDPAGLELREVLSSSSIDLQLHSVDDRPTTRKTRFVSGHQQILRLDEERALPLDQEQADRLIELLKSTIEWSRYKGVLISDYNKGFCHPSVCQFLIQKAQQLSIPVVVDPKGKDWDKYTGATCITPNVKELSILSGRHIENNHQDIDKAAAEVLTKYKLQNLLVTRSEKGMSLYNENGERYHLPTQAREVFDVSGAGDTVAAALLRFLSNGATLKESAALANHAAALVVAHWGTYALTSSELISSLEDQADHPLQRLIDLKDIANKVEQLKLENKKIVFTNGCFDILHRGHISYLQQAKELGDILILGLNSDASVKGLKGPSRPVNDEESRAHMLLALRYVDYVVIFDEETPYQLIKSLKPDILIKGGDYNIEDIVGREFAEETRTIPFVQGFSTTGIIKKMGEQ